MDLFTIIPRALILVCSLKGFGAHDVKINCVFYRLYNIKNVLLKKFNVYDIKNSVIIFVATELKDIRLQILKNYRF